MMKKTLLLAVLAFLSVGSTVVAQRYADQLNRGLVAIPQGDKTGQDERYGTTGTGIFVSWRKLATEYYDTQYNLYRNGTKVNATPLTVTNYQDNSGTASSKYKVVPVVKGVERTEQASAEVTPWEHQYWDIAVQPVVGRDGTAASGYTLNDCSVADVDGDGQMEFVVKRRNDSGNLRTEGNTNNFNLHECYKMDGTRLWWIDMGPNLMSGPDEQFDLILYDWDQDGKAEALMRGADNMIIYTKSGKAIKIGDMSYYAPRDEYTHKGKEYLLYLNGETGEPYGWDGSDNWTPMLYPLPRFEAGEAQNVYNQTSKEYAAVWGEQDTGHRSCKHYFGAPYLDGRNPSIFLGRGAYTRHKFCALDVNPATHELTQRWRWNCYDSQSPWFGNGFHNYQIADVDMDGRDEIVFGSMIIDDTGYGLSTTGYGHGDAQHCGDLDPYRWGLEQFVCLEGAAVPGIAYTDGMTSTLRYATGAGSDNGRCMAGNFQNTYPGAIGITYGYDVISLVGDRVITGVNMANDDYMNMRVYWDGDLLDEFMDSPGVERAPCVYKAPGQKEVHTGRSYANSRCWMGSGSLNNSSKNNPCFLGDIIGDWREEIVTRLNENTLRINVSSYESPWAITTLWADHEYRNAMAWQSVGYNQPPHPSFFLGELEGITKEPPAVVLEGRSEVANGATISTTDDHLLISGYEDKTIAVQEGASPWVLTVNTPAWVKGSGAQQAVASTPKVPTQTIESYTTTLTGGAFGGTTRLVKQGEGTLVLPNVVNKHTGNTDIWNGTLVFDGTMESSPVWLNRHTTLISDGGKFMGGLQADYNATVYVGGKDKVGGMTVAKLTMGFGSRFIIDWTAVTPEAALAGIDQLTVNQLVIETRDWSYGPKYKMPVLEIKKGDIALADGDYVLGTIGSVSGDVADITIEGLGDDYTSSLSVSEGKLVLTIHQMRASDIVYWNGTSASSIWEQAVSENFQREGTATYMANGDDVVFNDDATISTVNIKGRVTPRSVTFNNETKAYVIEGDSICAGAPIVKNGKGKLTFNNWNNSGNTTINGGTVTVTMLANNQGQFYGSLGDATRTITLNDGVTLQTNGTIFTDQQVKVSGSVTIDVPASKNLTLYKGIKGSGAVVTKTGTGSIEMGTGNTISKLIVKQGTVTSNYNDNNIDQLPATVEFQGGTLWGANQEGGSGVTNNADFVVPKSKTGTFYSSFRGVYRGTLTGAGTFNVYTGGIRSYWEGDWSEFEGTVVVDKNNRQNKKSYQPQFDFRNGYGLPKAKLKANEGVICSNNGYDFEVSRLEGNGTFAGSGQWIVGGDDGNFTLSAEVGITSDRTDDYGGTIAKSASKLTKRGTGKMSITTLGKINAVLTIEGGILAFNNTGLDTYVNGTNATIVKDGGRIVGQGIFSTLTVQDGGEVVLCGSRINETTPGVIKTNALTTINKGATLTFLFNSTKQSQLRPSMLRMNGTVKVTLLNDYVPAVGDEFTLWTGASSFSGTPTFDLPELPEGLYWDVDGVAQKTGVLRVTETPTGIGRILSSAQVDCEVFTLSGAKVAAFTTTKAKAAVEARRQGLQAGTYVIKMHDGWRAEAQKFIVK